MVDFAITENIFKIADQVFEVPLTGGDPWFAEAITIQTLDDSRGTTLVIDFSFVPDIAPPDTVIFYTLDNGITFVAFNDGQSLQGGQSRFLRVTNGNAVNFKADVDGTVNRCIVSEI